MPGSHHSAAPASDNEGESFHAYLSAFVPIDSKINGLMALIDSVLTKQPNDVSKDDMEAIQKEITSLFELVLASREGILSTLSNTFFNSPLCYVLTDIYPKQLKEHQEKIIANVSRYNDRLKAQLEKWKQNKDIIEPLSIKLIKELQHKLPSAHREDAWIQLLLRIAI